MKTQNLYRCWWTFVVPCCWLGRERQIPLLPLPDPGNVTLTLDEYNRLVDLAAKPPKKPDVAPLPYSIKHADLKLKSRTTA